MNKFKHIQGIKGNISKLIFSKGNGGSLPHYATSSMDILNYTILCKLIDSKQRLNNRTKLREARYMCSLLVEMLSNKSPEYSQFVKLLQGAIETQLAKSNDIVDLLETTFFNMRNHPRDQRSPEYMEFDSYFLKASLTPLTYMSDFSESDDGEDEAEDSDEPPAL